MPRTKKIKRNLSFEKLEEVAMRVPAKESDFLKFNHKTILKIRFLILTLLGTVITLTFILLFTSFAFIVFTANQMQKIKLYAVSQQNIINPANEEAVYFNDKKLYFITDKIKLNIINNSKESIYLAPCQYFNQFEKKVVNEWKKTSLVNCVSSDISLVSSIEKVSKKAEQILSASQLGKGIWRGVSTVYLGCEKAQIESCRESKTIYTSEFEIDALKQPISSSANRVN